MKSYRVAVVVAMALNWSISGDAARSRAEGPAMTSHFELATGNAALDEAYRKARRVIASDVKDGSFLAGTTGPRSGPATPRSRWTWPALLHPEVSKKTLLGLKEQVAGIGECWYQDKCGHFAGWPNLTDAIVGAAGAWSLYLVTGDRSCCGPSTRGPSTA